MTHEMTPIAKMNTIVMANMNHVYHMILELPAGGPPCCFLIMCINDRDIAKCVPYGSGAEEKSREYLDNLSYR